MPSVEFRWLSLRSVEGSRAWEVRTDAGSMAWGVYDKERQRIYVHWVFSARKGDFKLMMRKLVETLGTNHIVFCQVISEDLIRALLKKKHLIKEIEFFESPDETDLWLSIHVHWET